MEGIAPEWVAVSGFGWKRSLSDLAVWGFPEISRKIFPLKPYSTLFHPFFSPLAASSNSSTPQNPPFTSLDQAYSPFLPSTPPFFSLRTLPTSSGPFLVHYRTLSEHSRNPSIGSPKRPQKALFRAFRGFPPKPPKRAKIPLFRPFLTPFSPLPYPL